jgi:hypothetical protein
VNQRCLHDLLGRIACGPHGLLEIGEGSIHGGVDGIRPQIRAGRGEELVQHVSIAAGGNIGRGSTHAGGCQAVEQRQAVRGDLLGQVVFERCARLGRSQRNHSVAIGLEGIGFVRLRHATRLPGAQEGGSLERGRAGLYGDTEPPGNQGERGRISRIILYRAHQPFAGKSKGSDAQHVLGAARVTEAVLLRRYGPEGISRRLCRPANLSCAKRWDSWCRAVAPHELPVVLLPRGAVA